MYEISGSDDLKKAIRFLEEEADTQKSLLTGQLEGVVDSIRPSGILKDMVYDVMSSEYLKNNILNATLGISTGYVARKLFFNKPKNLFATISGYILEFGIAYLISHPPEKIKEIISDLLKLILKKDEKEEPATV